MHLFVTYLDRTVDLCWLIPTVPTLPTHLTYSFNLMTRRSSHRQVMMYLVYLVPILGF